MAQELKELLEKIKREGIDAAEERSRAIESEAYRRAEDIVRKAEEAASSILAEAREKIASEESSLKVSLKQAARDTLISLHQEIIATLDRVIASHVHKTLGPEEMSKILVLLIKDFGCAGKEKTIVTLRKEDLDRLEKSLLAELGSEMKKGIALKHSPGIKGGFTISYDGGKSYYDFTDRSLAGYIAAYVKPRLAKILEEAAA